MEPSIFTRIINGEIPSHKVYEDGHTLAFLDIHPSVAGHTLVVPKVQVARFEELADEDYKALFTTVKKVAQHMAEVFGADYRICLKVQGFDVPHVHVHVIACRDAADFFKKEDLTSEPDHASLADMAKRLAF
ncbi:MAG TPA: HIT family protein [Candidatus Saccharimonas sp.]|nr:HIT family protein [Candidatus Saccharimonas sp.]